MQQPRWWPAWIDTPPARWLAALGWMGLIFYFSSQSRLPSPDDPWVDFLFKKGAHFGVYAVLALLLWRALPPLRLRWVWAWLLTALYAISDEYHQSFVALRHPAARDVLIDICGAATALLLLAWWLRRDRRMKDAG